MLLLSVLVCISTLLQSSTSAPILSSKQKPIGLSYSCTLVFPMQEGKFTQKDVPIIFIHGLTSTRQTWRGIFEVISLKTKSEVCIVDLRNHGESPWNDDEIDAAAMAEDVKLFIEQHANNHKAIVVGHSLGGKVATHLALTYPETIEKIIVEDMRPNGITPEAKKDVQLYLQALKDVEKDMPQGVTEKEAKQKLLKPLKERLQELKVSLEVNDPSLIPIKCSNGKCQWRTNPILTEAFIRNFDEVLIESSGRFDGPALFIYGAESNFRVGDDESNIKKLFPNAELVEVEGEGHSVHKSKKFLEEAIKFINNN